MAMNATLWKLFKVASLVVSISAVAGPVCAAVLAPVKVGGTVIGIKGTAGIIPGLTDVYNHVADTVTHTAKGVSAALDYTIGLFPGK